MISFLGLKDKFLKGAPGPFNRKNANLMVPRRRLRQRVPLTTTTPRPLALVPCVGVAVLCVRLPTSLRSNIYVLAFSFALVNSHARMQLSKQLR